MVLPEDRDRRRHRRLGRTGRRRPCPLGGRRRRGTVGLPDRQGPAQHRGPLDRAVPRRLLPRRRHPHERAGRHRPGPVGHQGQGPGRARVAAAGRQCARPHPRVFVDRRRPPGRYGRRRQGRGRTRLHRREDERHRGTAVHRLVRQGRKVPGERGRRARRSRPQRRHRRGLPWPRAQAHGQGADEGAGPLQADVHRRAGAERALRGAEGTGAADVHADRAGRAPVLALGLQARAGRRLRRHHPARSVARRRHHRDAQDRRHGRGLRRGAGAALPAGPDRAGHLPADRRRLLQRLHPGTEPGHPLQRGQRPAGLRQQPRSVRLRKRHGRDSAGPGLGIEVNEEYVKERAAVGHRWRNPIWRHADGSFAEW